MMTGVSRAGLASPVLLVHGGAWDIPADQLEAHTRGVSHAAQAGYNLLRQGASSLDAVEAAVTILEDDETFDAGRGSFLTRDGRVQLDALLMDGATLRAGAVACVERLRNPIQAARLVLERSPHVYFAGVGAEEFAQEHGMGLIDNSELVLDRERLRLQAAQAREKAGIPDLTFAGVQPPAQSHDTVGAVALDAAGNLAAATSTGGTLNKAPGRVGDSSRHRLRRLRRQPKCGRLAHRMGRAYHEAGVGQVGRRPGTAVGAGAVRPGCHRVPLCAPPGPWRHHPARSRPAVSALRIIRPVWPGLSATARASAPAPA